MVASLALGTVQLGLPYGAANKTGMPSEEEAIAMLLHAASNGVRSLDTAHSYKLSQQRVGAGLRAMRERRLDAPCVVTKLVGGSDMDAAKSAEELVALVDASIAQSTEQLGMEPLDVVCFHYWGQAKLHGGAALARLKHHVAKGTARRFGTSTSADTADEVKEALLDPSLYLPCTFPVPSLYLLI